MRRKICFKCLSEKLLSEFYRHRYMADGHLNKCKECTKADVRKHRIANPERISDYERQRTATPKRRAQIRAQGIKYRERYPERYKAHNLVHSHIRDGKLLRQPCKVCGDPKAQAHHEDYSKPLDVQWLCFRCHRTFGHNQRVVSRHR